MGNSCLQGCVTSSAVKDEDVNMMAMNRVELAASGLFSIPGVAKAYHTSVVVNGEEYFFSDSGIISDRMLTSHQGTPSERIDLGYSHRTGIQLLHVLQHYFQPFTYDLVRKNCNTFSDCALYFLLRKRLERRFTAMERLGMGNLDLLQQVTRGMYVPNEAAANFKVDVVIQDMDKLPEKLSSFAGSEQASLPLKIGMQVTVVGLVNAKDLNGFSAKIVRYNPVNGRWEAKLDDSDVVKAFRIENLRPAGQLALDVEERVRIHSLTSEAGQTLNGQEGVVTRYMHDKSRYEVCVGGATKALKAENLERCV